MIDSPRISVALCTYNGERFIAQQIESILAQSMPVDEIVLGDDASSDTTVQKVEERVAGTNIDLVVRRHNPGLGVRGNFADAISATTGDVIILCDQDDVWHQDKVENLLKLLVTKSSFIPMPALSTLRGIQRDRRFLKSSTSVRGRNGTSSMVMRSRCYSSGILLRAQRLQ